MASFANKCPECGTKIKIRDRKLDGKKARCPQCAATFRIKAPHATNPQAAKPQTAKRPPAALRAPSEEFSFLKRITEGDLADFGPPEDDSDKLDDAAPETAARSTRPTRSDTDKQRSRSKSRRKESSSRSDLVIGGIVLGIGLLLLAGVAFVAWQYVPSMETGGAARMAWMPDDIEGFLEVEPDKLWNARALRPLREAEYGVRLREYFDKVLSPISLSDVERIAVGFPPAASASPDPVFVVSAKSSFDVPALTSQAGEFRETTYGDHTYYVGGQPPRAAFFADSGVLVYSTEEQVKALIDRGSSSAAADHFQLPGYGTIVFATRNPQRFGKPDLSAMAGPHVGETAAGLSGYAIVADVGHDFEIEGTLSYDSEDAAAELVTTTTGQVEKAVAELEFERGEKLNTDPTFKLNVGGAKQLFTAQQQVLESLELSQSGSDVHFEVTLPAALLEFAADAFEFLAADAFPDANLFDEEPKDPELPELEGVEIPGAGEPPEE